MLSRYPHELARRTNWTCLSCTSLSRTSAALITAPRRSSAQTHQRKHSSSKTSSSPKEDSRAIATATDPANKVVTQEAKPASSPEVPEAPEKRSAARSSKRKSKESTRNAVEKADYASQLNLPSVPSTQNLHPLNVHLASFFSTHRPLSITNAIPPQTSTSAFSSLFEPKLSSKPTPSDVIYTLSSAVNNLENPTSHQQQPAIPEDVDLHTVVSQASSATAASTHDLDLPAKSFHINLQDLAKSFRPYTPPPPPVPLAALQEAAGKTTRGDRRNSTPAERKSYKTTLTIYESTNANGQRSYETHSSPLVIEPSSSDHIKRLPPARPRGQPFLGRMRERQIKYQDRLDDRVGSEIWQTLSVKRQRKLKMKKHKYKKLMKRTKNLRRRLDRQ